MELFSLSVYPHVSLHEKLYKWLWKVSPWWLQPMRPGTPMSEELWIKPSCGAVIGAEKCYSLQITGSEPRDLLAISNVNAEIHQSRGSAPLFSSKMITMVLLWAVCGSIFAMPKETLKFFSGPNSSQTHLSLSLTSGQLFKTKESPNQTENLYLKAKIHRCFGTSTLPKVCIVDTIIFFLLLIDIFHVEEKRQRN